MLSPKTRKRDFPTLEGRAYLNIHTSTNPGGEIRSFLEPVPEPATTGLIAIGLFALVALRRR